MNSMVWLAGTRILRPLSREDPQGHTAYNNRLLEAVNYEIYKLKAYKLGRLRKVVR